MNYLISILPIILYFLFIKGMDGFSLSKWSKIAECFAWGLVTCLICLGLSMFWNPQENSLFPIVEEIIKALPIVLIVHRKRSTFFLEILTYGAAIGAGFAFFENILYTYYQPLTLGDTILRGLGTSLLHIGCTALYGGIALVLFRMTKGKRKALRRTMTAVAILPPIAIHFLYNLFLLPEYIQMVLVIAIFICLFIWIYSLDEKMIHKWLDVCISNDIALYKSIKEGQLSSTNAGQYLMSIKERFSPEVFFDILVFLGLYLEMSIAAKSRMIMKEAGMDTRLDSDEHQANMEKVAEIKILRKSIGKTAVALLRPLVSIKDTDVWAMQQML